MAVFVMPLALIAHQNEDVQLLLLLVRLAAIKKMAAPNFALLNAIAAFLPYQDFADFHALLKSLPQLIFVWQQVLPPKARHVGNEAV